MALDFKKMKEKLALSESGGKSRGDSVFWRPQEGDTDIRILPTADEDPFKVFHFHYNMGEAARGGVLCPKRQFGDSCPICDFASKLWQEGTDESKKQAKDLFVRQRFYSPIIIRGEDASRARVWGYSKTVYEKLLSLCLNPEYGDITLIDDGLDFTLSYTLPKTKGAYPSIDLVPKRKSSSLLKDKKAVAALLESIPAFDSLFEKKTTEDVKAILEAFISPSEGPFSESTAPSGVDEAIRELTA
jgi:hypothetical protein